MSVASTAMCWWLWIYILDRVPAWEASLSVLGTPVVAILSSRLTFGEEFKAPCVFMPSKNFQKFCAVSTLFFFLSMTYSLSIFYVNRMR